MRHIDPATGRAYEVGPDGITRWVDDPAPTQAFPPIPAHQDPTLTRPWYRKLRFMLPIAAVAGFVIGSASAGAAGQTSAPLAAPASQTVTTTVTSAATTTAPPVTRTFSAAPKTVPPVTVTKRVTVTAPANAGVPTKQNSGTDVYYANCSAARAAGAAPLYAGQPGYRAGLDRDGDGVACE
jgi:Excalibur calcium-binding domain